MAPTRASTKSPWSDRRWCRERSSISGFDFASPNEEKPATAGSRAGEDLQPVVRSLPYAVDALAVVGFAGLDAQPHFLAQRAGQETADRMRLPAGGFHKAFQRHAAGLLQQREHLGRLAALAPTRGCCGLGGLLGLAVLMGRLRLGWCNTRLRRGAFSPLGRLWRLWGLGRFSIFSSGCRHGGCSFGGDDRRHDMNHSEALEMQAKSVEIGKNDGMAMRAGTRGRTWRCAMNPNSFPCPLTVFASASTGHG